VTQREGLRESLSIAQVAEVLRCLRDEIQADPQAARAAARYLMDWRPIGGARQCLER
jgi:hypothetical protein